MLHCGCRLRPAREVWFGAIGVEGKKATEEKFAGNLKALEGYFEGLEGFGVVRFWEIACSEFINLQDITLGDLVDVVVFLEIYFGCERPQ